MRLVIVSVFLTLSCLLLIGCGDGPDDGGGDPVVPTEPTCEDGLQNGDEEGVDCGGTCATACAVDPPANPWAGPSETNDWRVLFSYRGRIDNSTKGQNELWVMDPQGLDLVQVTDFGGDDDDDSDGNWTCNYGCVVSPDLKWIAVVTGPPTVDGFTFEIGIIKDDLSVKMAKFPPFANKVDFKFAGDKLYFTEKVPCTGVSCQYDLYMFDLSGLSGSNKVLTFPTAAELEDSTYKGHFKVSPAGDKVVLLNTTIRSVTVNMWVDGLGLIELDYICKFGTKGNCSGTGSEYSDIDPVAISPDGRYVVFFTYSDRWQRARVYDAENPGVVTFSVLAEVPTGSYIEHACDPGVL
ncbi:MAG: hypothetical protein VX938_05640, partial [Myxococcota bacterium]|nr:hypothetical protein [Myxococcota bacterium]